MSPDEDCLDLKSKSNKQAKCNERGELLGTRYRFGNDKMRSLGERVCRNEVIGVENDQSLTNEISDWSKGLGNVRWCDGVLEHSWVPIEVMSWLASHGGVAVGKSSCSRWLVSRPSHSSMPGSLLNIL